MMPGSGRSKTSENGLVSTRRAMVDKITTVPKSKLGGRLGQLDNDDLVRMTQALLVFLDLVGLGRDHAR